MYLGVGGVNRLVYSAGISKVENVTPLSSARYNLAATSVGNYALFGGGRIDNYNYSYIVDVYDTSLVRGNYTLLRIARDRLAATSIGEYAIFGGGESVDDGIGGIIRNTVDVYTA